MASDAEKKDHKRINDEIPLDASGGRPKSKRELRLERKAAKRKLTEQNTATKTTATLTTTTKAGNNNDGEKVVLDKEEYRKLKKLKRAELQKEQEKVLRKELREEKKLRKRKKLNRELNAKGGAKKKLKATDTATAGQSNALVETGEAEKSSSSKKKKADNNNSSNNNKKTTRNEHDTSMNAFRSVVYGTTAASTESGGMTTTRLGVQYQDKVVGKGKLLREGKPVTVKYELTGGKFGAVLDSSKKFTFRAGMGEVIRGWDIGLEGMREGGRRKLIVPPKAGYGGKDIGAGPGALLYFDVTLLSCGK